MPRQCDANQMVLPMFLAPNSDTWLFLLDICHRAIRNVSPVSHEYQRYRHWSTQIVSNRETLQKPHAIYNIYKCIIIMLINILYLSI